MSLAATSTRHCHRLIDVLLVYLHARVKFKFKTMRPSRYPCVLSMHPGIEMSSAACCRRVACRSRPYSCVACRYHKKQHIGHSTMLGFVSARHACMGHGCAYRPPAQKHIIRSNNPSNPGLFFLSRFGRLHDDSHVDR